MRVLSTCRYTRVRAPHLVASMNCLLFSHSPEVAHARQSEGVFGSSRRASQRADPATAPASTQVSTCGKAPRSFAEGSPARRRRLYAAPCGPWRSPGQGGAPGGWGMWRGVSGVCGVCGGVPSRLSRRETSRSLARLQCGGGVGAGGLALLLHEGGVGGAFARRRPVAAVLVHVLALLPQLLLLLLGRCDDRLVVAWLGRPLPRRLARRELVVVRLAARRVHRRSPPARQLRRRCRCSRRCSRLNCRGDILLMQGRVRRRPLRPTDVRDTGSEKRNHRRRDQPDRRLGTATAA